MQNEVPPPPPEDSNPLTNEPVHSSGSYRKPADYYASPQQPVPDKKGGCPKWALIGCGGGGCLVLLVILVGGSFFVRGGMPKLLDFAFSRVEREISSMAAAEVTVEQKDALRAEMTRYRENIRAERIPMAEVQPVLQELQSTTGDSRLTTEEVDKLTRLLREKNDAAEGSTAPAATAGTTNATGTNDSATGSATDSGEGTATTP